MSRTYGTECLRRRTRVMLRMTLAPRFGELNDQRAVLILKELAGSLTPKEYARLDYLRWQLDQIEEALLGDNWDVMQVAVARQAALARSMEDFIEDLKAATPTELNSRK